MDAGTVAEKGILLLHYSCPPVVGGVEEIIRQQATLFHRYGHPVKVIAGDGDRFSEAYEIKINPLLSSRNAHILELQKYPEMQSDALEIITDQIHESLLEDTHGFDFLIAHNILTMHYNLPLTRAVHRLADSGRIHLIAWNHDSPYFYDRLPFDPNLEDWQILKYYNPRIHHITISECRRTEFLNLYQNHGKIQVIENGIDPIRFFRLDPNTLRIIKERKLFEADLILVQPSRLHPRKNFELSVKLIRALRYKGINAFLLATGAHDPHEEMSHQYYQKLMRLAKRLGVADNILLTTEFSFKNGERLSADRMIMRDLYLISDVLFLPSLQEGFGIPLLEAGMIKLPIFCSDIPPFRSIGGDMVYNFSISDSPQQIAAMMIDKLDQLKPHGMFRHVIKNYVWDHIYDHQLKPLLEQIAATADT